MTRVLVTRPEPAASRTAELLRCHGHEPVVAPLFKPVDLDVDDWPEPEGLGALAVTSARAITAMEARPIWPRLAALPVFAVGAACGAAARAAGCSRVTVAGGTMDTLAEAIVEGRPAWPVLYLAGRHRSGDLCGALARSGIGCGMREVYAMERAGDPPAMVRAALTSGALRHVLVYSRRGGQALADVLGRLDRPPPPLRIYALSENAGAPLRPFGALAVAENPSEAALIALFDAAC